MCCYPYDHSRSNREMSLLWTTTPGAYKSLKPMTHYRCSVSPLQTQAGACSKQVTKRPAASTQNTHKKPQEKNKKKTPSVQGRGCTYTIYYLPVRYFATTAIPDLLAASSARGIFTDIIWKIFQWITGIRRADSPRSYARFDAHQKRTQDANISVHSRAYDSLWQWVEKIERYWCMGGTFSAIVSNVKKYVKRSR